MRKYSVSVTADLKDRLKSHAQSTGRSMASIVDEATKDCVVVQSSNPETSPAPISSSSSCDTAST